MPLRKSVLISGLVKRYRWWASLAAVKSTTGRALLRLVESQGGEIIFNGQRIDTLSPGKLQALRRDISVYFSGPLRFAGPTSDHR